MITHNFKINGGDTDSLTFYKEDQSPFTEEERTQLLQELNSLYPQGLTWEDDGYYPREIVLKAKNYILWDGKKIKLKGSSLKDSKKEPALKEFCNEIIQSLLFNAKPLNVIYTQYLREAMAITDIRRWTSKKSLSATTFSSERTNESKIVDAIAGTDYREGDKVYLFFLEDGSLQLAERFDGSYDKMVMVKKLFKSTEIFDTILPEDTFKNYSLKRNYKELCEICGIPPDTLP